MDKEMDTKIAEKGHGQKDRQEKKHKQIEAKTKKKIISVISIRMFCSFQGISVFGVRGDEERRGRVGGVPLSRRISVHEHSRR